MADDSSDSDDEEYIPEGDRDACSSEDEKYQLEDTNVGKVDDGGEERERKEKENEEEKKNRFDELWAGFKNDVGAATKTKPIATLSKETKVESDSHVGSDETETLVIKKTFDFAGEDVVVEEKVRVDSQEALDYTRKTQSQNDAKPSTSTGLLQTKRGLSASALLESLNKKPKISTLEKSRLDWNKYKTVEGISEELQFHKKDGYLEKKEFLQRTDLRQFELEKEERLKRFKKLV